MSLLSKKARTKFLGLLPLSLLVIIGAVIRFIDVAQESVWLDEAFSVFLTYNEPSVIIERSVGDNSPPLFYLILHYMTQWFGSSEAAIRFPSVLFGIGMIPLAYLIGKRMFSQRVGLFSALFVTFSPILIWYSQDARAYAMMTFFALMSFWALIEATVYRRDLFWILFAFSTALMFYSHYFSFFFAALEALLFFFFWKWKDWKTFKYALLGGVGAIVLYIPWLAKVVGRQVGDSNALYWAVTNEHSLKVTLLHFIGGHPNAYLLAWNPPEFIVLVGMFLVPAILLGGTVLAIRRKEARPYLSLLILAIVPAVVTYLLTNHHTPMYHTRFFVYSVPFMFVAVAYVLGNFESLFVHQERREAIAASLRWVFSGVILLVMISTWTYMHTHHDKEDWRSGVNYVLDNAQDGDAVVAEPRYFLIPVSYYLGMNTTPSVFTATVDGRRITFYGNDYLWNTDLNQQLEKIAANSTRIWRFSASYSPVEIEQWLEENYVRVERQEFSLIQATLYERKQL